MRLKDRIGELERYTTNISFIQDQLLKELGYEIKHRNPYEPNLLYIQKIDSKKEKSK